MRKVKRWKAICIALTVLCLAAIGPSFAAAADPLKGGRVMEVEFPGSGGFMLKGTLTLPVGSKSFPALLLLPGSGPTDRNGNQPPALITDLLKQIAERLAQEGVATLRFDKRASHGYAAAWPKDADSLNRFFAWPRFTEDAKLAYLYLRTSPGIDAKRTGILGHSEGGIIALAVGSELAPSPERPAALVLAGTPGRTLAAVVRNQVADLLERQKATPEQTSFFLGKCDSIGEAIVRTGKTPADVPPGLAALYPASAALYLQSVLPLDPKDLARHVVGPVLVMNGEKDIQVSPEKDARPLATALKSRKGSAPLDLEIVAGASHSLKPLSADPNGLTGPAAPASLNLLASWLKAHLAGTL